VGAAFGDLLRVDECFIVIDRRLGSARAGRAQLLLGDGREFGNRRRCDRSSFDQEGVLLPVQAVELKGPVVSMPGQDLRVVHEADILLGQEWHEALRPPFTAFLPVIEGFGAGIGGDGA
jgi:hypothetical protein